MDAAGSFRKELFETAHALVRPGYGILAADESTGTIGGKFEKVGIENSEENRRKYRTLLFETPNLEQHISGVILFDETTKQSNDKGVNLVELLKSRNIIPGIKVDKGLQDIPGTDGEKATVGLDDLAVRVKAYYAQGIRFAKWRAVIKITKVLPSELALQEIAWGLARYAAICQSNGVVPIVEPEVLADGEHDIHRCAEVSQRCFAVVVKALHDQKIYWEGCLLKPNMITPGLDYPDRSKVTPQETAAITVRTLLRTIPGALPGIVVYPSFYEKT
jgi:fructose-bisphosphate aldolase, class I